MFKVNWQTQDSKFKYWAADRDGLAFFFTVKPILEAANNWWTIPDGVSGESSLDMTFCGFDQEEMWSRSLQSRPAVVEALPTSFTEQVAVLLDRWKYLSPEEMLGKVHAVLKIMPPSQVEILHNIELKIFKND